MNWFCIVFIGNCIVLFFLCPCAKFGNFGIAIVVFWCWTIASIPSPLDFISWVVYGGFGTNEMYLLDVSVRSHSIYDVFDCGLFLVNSRYFIIAHVGEDSVMGIKVVFERAKLCGLCVFGFKFEIMLVGCKRSFDVFVSFFNYNIWVYWNSSCEYFGCNFLGKYSIMVLVRAVTARC